MIEERIDRGIFAAATGGFVIAATVASVGKQRTKKRTPKKQAVRRRSVAPAAKELNGHTVNAAEIKSNTPVDTSPCSVVCDIPGRIRLKHPRLRQNPVLCSRIENALINMVEVKKYKVNKHTASVLIVYDSQKVANTELCELVDDVLKNAPDEAFEVDNRLAVSTAVFGLSMLVTPAVPALIPVNLLLVMHTATPTFKAALHSIFVERRVKVDILDSIVILFSAGMGSLGAASFMVWILDVAGKILEGTTETSRRLLSQAFGKQAHYAYLYKNGVETKVPVDKLSKGDVIVIHTGDGIPVDGIVTDGEAMVDQASLTGEAAPAEKKTEDRVFAATTVVAGKIYVKVEASGAETNASKIVKIINETAKYKSKTHNMGVKFADRMVLPTLGLAAVGSVTGGPAASLAIINADFGTGIRIAAPMAVLSTLAYAARSGIVIKDGRVLEDMQRVNAVLFDKTGTLTHETPEVARVICANGHFKDSDIMTFAAAAEQRFSHPIARAILEKAFQMGLKLPPRDDSKFHVGFGIQVQIGKDEVKVGSVRYMARENISINGPVQAELERIHNAGRSAIMVAVNDKLAGVVELKASQRPESAGVISRLKERGIEELVLISGDHKAATKEMASQLGMTRYFAEVLPQDKAKYVKQLQDEGKVVAMVGDGINDSVALSQADVSISLSGATSVATDVAKVVFMDGNLGKFDKLFQVSEMLQKNVSRSFKMIVVPNSICIAGAMFGVIGLTGSLVLNNGFNMIATAHGMAPMFKEVEQEQQQLAG